MAAATLRLSHISQVRSSVPSRWSRGDRSPPARARRRSQRTLSLAAPRRATRGALGRGLCHPIATARGAAPEIRGRSERRRDVPARGWRRRRCVAGTSSCARGRRESAVGDGRILHALLDSSVGGHAGRRALAPGAWCGSRSGVCRQRRNPAARGRAPLGFGHRGGARPLRRRRDTAPRRRAHPVRGRRVERKPRGRGVAGAKRRIHGALRRRPAGGRLQPR